MRLDNAGKQQEPLNGVIGGFLEATMVGSSRQPFELVGAAQCCSLG